jgi:hypothetical protein
MGIALVPGFNGITEITPGYEPAGKRPNKDDALLPESKRHPGAGGLVGSGAIDNDLAARRNACKVLHVFVGYADGARYDMGVGFEIKRMAHIDDQDIFAGIKLSFQFLRRYASNDKFADESPARNVLP